MNRPDAQGRSAALVGRDAELAALDVVLAGLIDGEGSVICLSGEPGIGKTALIGHVLGTAAAGKVTVASARAAEFESDVPFAVVTEALEPLLAGTGAGELELAPGDRAALAPLFPALAGSEPAPSPADADPARLRRALRGLLTELAAQRPFLLALDDLHWADAASIDLVASMAHRALDAPLLLVLATRPAQTPQRLLSALEEAERHELGRRIDLGPLSEEEAGEIVSDLAPAQRAEVFRESGGNPFYLTQLAAATRRGAAPGTTGESPRGQIPAAIRAVITDELSSLSPRARELLDAASVVGEPFEPELAAVVAELEDADAIRALDELAERDLIRRVEGSRRYRFRHPIVHDAVYEATGHGRRAAAHARAAAALEDRGASTLLRAHHVQQSAQLGDETAVELLTSAGQEAAGRSPASAARWFKAALELIPDGPGHTEQRLALLVQRAVALGVAGNVEENRQTLRAFLSLSPQEPNPLRLRAVVLTAAADGLLGFHDEARELLLAEIAAQPDQSSAAVAELNRQLAFTSFLDADWEGMRKWAGASLAADCQGMVRVGALSALALARYGVGEIAEATEPLDEAVKLFEQLPAAEIASPGIAIWVGWAEVCLERYDAAIRHLERVRTLGESSIERPFTLALLVAQGQAQASKGRIDTLAELADAALEVSLVSAGGLSLSWTMPLKCHVEWRRGDLLAALRFGERGVAAGGETRSPLGEIARFPLAEVLLEIGEPERAMAQLLDADGELRKPEFALYEAYRYELLTRAELMRGDVDAARAYADRAGAYAAGRHGMKMPLVQARRAEALVELAAGRHEAAAELAYAAVEAADAIGAEVEAGRARILAGRALAEAGSREQAVAELQRAYDDLALCGALRHCNEAGRELRRLGHVARHASNVLARSAVAGLTAREREVMELVAAGRTNRQIADELVLSVRTVDRHVSRILQKLDVRSRAAAASEFERAR